MDTDKHLDELYKTMFNDLIKEQDQNINIKEEAELAARKMMTGVKSILEINERTYSLRHKSMPGSKNNIVLVAVDLDKYKLLQEKYQPFIIHGEINNGLTMQENLSATVEAFIRHIIGAVKPEEFPT